MRKLVGHVGVDSGTLMIVDPCYVLEDDRTDGEESSVYLQAVLPVPKEAFNFARYDGHVDAVISSTLWGDGSYPVFVEYDDAGNALRMIVEFDLDIDGQDISC
jgi:hypothetical protein